MPSPCITGGFPRHKCNWGRGGVGGGGRGDWLEKFASWSQIFTPVVCLLSDCSSDRRCRKRESVQQAGLSPRPLIRANITLATPHTKSCPHTTNGIKKIKYQSNVEQPHSKASYLSTCGQRYIHGPLKLGSVSNFLLVYQCLDLFLIHYLINLSVSPCHSQEHISHKLPGQFMKMKEHFSSVMFSSL